ncbi:PoNe immunity protein domain-containing protein [Roseivirga sp. BDSF3-8]|uniref:PoNe immunity protein domain-containing protein n=1 Tax=Roseivirga sp. BDSF3-8 TaxID=3241598 RepID=UPI00353224B3
MRDNIKDQSYFEAYIKSSIERHERGEDRLRSGNVKPERVAAAGTMMISSLIQRIKAKYSYGLPASDIEDDLKIAIDLISKYWPGYWKMADNDGKVLNQYSLDPYDEMLWMFSLGYLLDVSKVQFEKLVNVIDQDQVKDKLFEFITLAKIPNRPKLKEESYKHGWKLFGKLREATETEDKAKAESLIKAFLEKDWYKEHKNAGWYDNHKGKHDTYSGYWCFEAAAVTCIKGLDDSTYRDQQYYPKDLADYYRANH